jgi:hypothetical protein
VYFGFSFIIRFILPLILRNSIKNFQQRNNGENTSQPSGNKKEGEVTIEYVNKDSKSSSSHQDEEYVDFEEIK